MLKLAFVNLRGLNNKLNDILLLSGSVDVILMVETWLLPSTPSPIPPSFRTPLDLRIPYSGSGRPSGGLMAITSPSISCSILFQHPSGTWAHLKLDSLHVVVAYFSPSTPPLLFHQFLDELELLSSAFPDLLVCGDFNARMTRLEPRLRYSSPNKCYYVFC